MPRWLADLAYPAWQQQKAEWDYWQRRFKNQASSEAIHGLRVTGRRLRAVLKIFASLWDSRATALERSLRAAGIQLGAVRDLDVHLAYLDRATRRWPARERAGLKQYRRYLLGQR